MRALGLVLVAGFAVGQAAGAADDPKAVIEKAIKAHGGADKLNKFTGTRAKVKGTIDIMGNEVEVKGEILSQYPDKGKAVINLAVGGMDLKVVQIANGDKFSVKINDMPVPLPDEEKEDARMGIYVSGLQQLTPLLKDPYKLAAGDEIKVNDKPAVGVVVSHAKYKDVKLFFDKESGMLVKVERKGRKDGAEVNEEQVFSEYKEVSGVKVPTKETVTKDGKKSQELTLTEVELVEKIDDKEFAVDD